MLSQRISTVALIMGLIVSVGPPLCGAQDPEPETGGPHAMVVVKDGRFQARAGDEITDIEELTTYCLQCHGEGATGGVAEKAPKAQHTVTGLGRSHPVDVAYPDGEPGYHPLSTVSVSLPVREGRMTCLTCHAATPDRELVLPLRGSSLCIVCHAK